jgi:hypothetical protein
VQAPEIGLQLPGFWHGSGGAAHITGEPARQLPFTQLSLWVHRLLSALHSAPFTFGGLLQAPVEGSHSPGSWHASGAGHAFAGPTTHAPFMQLSCVQRLASTLHIAPFTFGV